MTEYICVSCWGSFEVEPGSLQDSDSVVCTLCGAVQPAASNLSFGADPLRTGEDGSDATLEVDLPDSLIQELKARGFNPSEEEGSDSTLEVEVPASLLAELAAAHDKENQLKVPPRRRDTVRDMMSPTATPAGKQPSTSATLTGVTVDVPRPGRLAQGPWKPPEPQEPKPPRQPLPGTSGPGPSPPTPPPPPAPTRAEGPKTEPGSSPFVFGVDQPPAPASGFGESHDEEDLDRTREDVDAASMRRSRTAAWNSQMMATAAKAWADHKAKIRQETGEQPITPQERPSPPPRVPEPAPAPPPGPANVAPPPMGPQPQAAAQPPPSPAVAEPPAPVAEAPAAPKKGQEGTVWKLKLKSGLVLKFPTLRLVAAWAADKPADEIRIAKDDGEFQPYAEFLATLTREDEGPAAGPQMRPGGMARIDTQDDVVGASHPTGMSPAAAAVAARRAGGEMARRTDDFKFRMQQNTSSWVPKAVIAGAGVLVIAAILLFLFL